MEHPCATTLSEQGQGSEGKGERATVRVGRGHVSEVDQGEFDRGRSEAKSRCGIAQARRFRLGGTEERENVLLGMHSLIETLVPDPLTLEFVTFVPSPFTR